jgi:DNA-binding CsgD family transcriptional regulator
MPHTLLYNKITGISALQSHLEYTLESSSASIYWKDKKGRYLGANNIFVRSADGFSLDRILGNDDRGLCWGESEALLMQKNDKKVVDAKQSKTVIESAYCYEDKKHRKFLSHKTPLRGYKGNVIGVFGISFILDGKASTSKAIEDAGFPAYFLNINDTQAGLNTENHNLTLRQLDCLYYLVNGMTVKQIGRELNLSPRTIEHYLETIKLKLNCYSRADLISKSLQLDAIKRRL